jgi:opacity protein-like surface antigen
MLKIVSSVLLIFTATAASAAENRLSLLLSKTTISANDEYRESDSLNNGFKLGFSRQVSSVAGFQVDYADYGNENRQMVDENFNADIRIKVRAVNAYFVAENRVSDALVLSGRIGLSHWQADYQFALNGSVDFPSDSVKESKNATDLVYGIGASWYFNQFIALRLELQRVDADDNLDSTHAGLEFRF